MLYRGGSWKSSEVPIRPLLGAAAADSSWPARMVDPAANPLLPRVLVNRLWKHHFGEGLVKTTDDFGAMGQKPSHPELLDWLAVGVHRERLVDQGDAPADGDFEHLPDGAAALREDAERLDPANVYLHRMNVRRLEAEAIRDALLAVSGRLDRRCTGPVCRRYLTPFMDGRGRPGRSGPLDGDGRRSIYLNVRRNFLNPMFLAFDMPVPFSTMGRRNVSNVPAQALTLMNDPLVVGQARLWAERLMADPTAVSDARLDSLLYDTPSAARRLMTKSGRPGLS